MTEGAIVWFTGLPSAGKSTLARALRERLAAGAVTSCVLDGDDVRAALVPPLGYDAEAREQFYTTLGNLAILLAGQGMVVLVAATAHLRRYRERVQKSGVASFEVWVDVPLEEVRRRDSKGLYSAFAAGRGHSLPGEDLPYEPPANPFVVAHGGADPRALDRLAAFFTARSAEDGSAAGP